MARARAPSPAPCSRIVNGSGRPRRQPGVAQPGRQRGPEDRVQLRRGQEVAAGPAGARVGGPVVAAVGVVQGEGHEPGEGHRPVASDLVADALDEAGVLADGLEVRAGLVTQLEAGVHVSPAAPGAAPARPGCDRRARPGSAASRAAAVSSRSHGSAMDAGRSRSDAKRSSVDGQRAASPACRWASRTRLSMRAASPRPASTSPRAPGPRSSRSDPRTLRGGRWPGGAVRIPRSSTSARVRAAPARSTQRRTPGDVRPATSSSAAGSATTARSARQPVADDGRGVGGQGGGPAATEEDEVERAVDVDAEPPAPAPVLDRDAARLEPARQAVVAGQLRRFGQDRPGVGQGDDVGRVAVVGEGSRGVGRGGRDQVAVVAGAGERHGARPEDHEPAVTERRDQRGQSQRRTASGRRPVR